MTPNGNDSREEERAALLAAGAFLAHEAAEAEASADEWEFMAVAAMLADAFPTVDPPPGVKDKILARVAQLSDSRSADRAAAAALPEISFQFVEDSEFVQSPYPQLSVRMLHVDRVRNRFSALIRLEPGASFPAHRHDGPEECLVLEGELLVGGVRMKAGDFQRVESGTEHVEQRSPDGALLFVTAPLSLLSP